MATGYEPDLDMYGEAWGADRFRADLAGGEICGGYSLVLGKVSTYD